MNNVTDVRRAGDAGGGIPFHSIAVLSDTGTLVVWDHTGEVHDADLAPQWNAVS